MSIRSVPALVLLALCLAVLAEAQTGVQAQPGTIAGVVIDDRTGQPIRGVSVYVENQANIVETDVNGRFSLMAPRGPQTIIASVIAAIPNAQAANWVPRLTLRPERAVATNFVDVRA